MVIALEPNVDGIVRSHGAPDPKAIARIVRALEVNGTLNTYVAVVEVAGIEAAGASLIGAHQVKKLVICIGGDHCRHTVKSSTVVNILVDSLLQPVKLQDTHPTSFDVISKDGLRSICQ
jgi:hypothetical protein